MHCHVLEREQYVNVLAGFSSSVVNRMRMRMRLRESRQSVVMPEGVATWNSV